MYNAVRNWRAQILAKKNESHHARNLAMHASKSEL